MSSADASAISETTSTLRTRTVRRLRPSAPAVVQRRLHVVVRLLPRGQQAEDDRRPRAEQATENSQHGPSTRTLCRRGKSAGSSARQQADAGRGQQRPAGRAGQREHQRFDDRLPRAAAIGWRRARTARRARGGRAVARASSRLETFAHAMSITTPTPASSSTSASLDRADDVVEQRHGADVPCPSSPAVGSARDTAARSARACAHGGARPQPRAPR